MENLEKIKKKLEYEQDENNKKIKKYEDKIKELEIDEAKYANAIAKHKSLQNEIEEYIEDRTELKNKINELNQEISEIQQHADELRKQSKRDSLSISRVTHCNDELVKILGACEDFLNEKASKYLPVSVIDADDLELTESDDEKMENDQDKQQKKKNAFDTVRVSGKENIMYFDDSDYSDNAQMADAEDDIYKIEKQKDAASLQMAHRLEFQVSLVTEQLEKFSESIRNFKNALRRKEEESMRQQHALRQVAMRRQLQLQIKQELVKREQNMVSIASVRGVSMRHKTSLSNLTKTQDEIDRVVQKFEEKDANWKENISLQLSGNTKSISMGLQNDPNSTGSDSVQSTKSQKSKRRMRRSKQDVFETQSVRSLSSSASKKSLHLQNTKSLGGGRLGRSKNLHRSQSANVAPLSENNSVGGEEKKEDSAKKNKSFKAKWFGL